MILLVALNTGSAIHSLGVPTKTDCALDPGADHDVLDRSGITRTGGGISARPKGAATAAAAGDGQHSAALDKAPTAAFVRSANGRRTDLNSEHLVGGQFKDVSDADAQTCDLSVTTVTFPLRSVNVNLVGSGSRGWLR